MERMTYVIFVAFAVAAIGQVAVCEFAPPLPGPPAPQSGDIANKSTRLNLVVGNLTVGDRFLYLNTITRNAIPNAVQSENIIFTGAIGTRLTYIRALEVGVSQGATATIVAGGIGQNYVNILLRSAASRGYSYTIDIYGR